MGLRAAVGRGPVALDTVAFIYFIEDHSRYAPLVAQLFSDADRGLRLIVTSALTLLEVLVVPYRAGDLALAERYEAILSHSRGVRLVELDHTQLRAAAQLRAAYRVRTPDALQLAAALLLVRLLIYILRLALGPGSWVVRWETRLTLGLWLLFGSTRTGTRQLYVSRPDGTDVRAITDVPEGNAAMWGTWEPVATAQ